MSDAIGVLLCGHGSRDPAAIAEFSSLADALVERFRPWPVEYGFLEFARPIIREGLDKLAARGIRHILAVPGMLFAAGHAKNDIPSVLNAYQAQRPGLKIEYARDLGLDPRMLLAAGARIEEALADAGEEIATHDTLLVVVGRGASDPDANSNVAKVARMLWEGFGFGWAETAYSGVTFPLVEPALEKAARLGFRRIVVFPYFLFTGVLVERICEAADRVAANYPHIDFVKAPYLGDHPLVLDTFVDRAWEILSGDNRMNCGLCKYRTQVLGFEAEVGLPQESHHHHVEGVGLEASFSHREKAPAKRADQRLVGDVLTSSPVAFGDTLSPWEREGASSALAAPHHHHHGHHHHHHDHAGGHHFPYPHADHPLGPRSLKRG
jgi:sirohydrochlorin cobaltochelatase